MVHVEETTSHRRFAGFFIRNAEHAQRTFHSIHAAPLPLSKAQIAASAAKKAAGPQQGAKPAPSKPAGAPWASKRSVKIAA